MKPVVPSFLFSIFSALFRSRRRAGEHGQILVLSALLLPMLLGITGLGIDYGVGVAVRRNTQNAADAAALAGAGILRDGGTATSARTAAFSWDQKNGYLVQRRDGEHPAERRAARRRRPARRGQHHAHQWHDFHAGTRQGVDDDLVSRCCRLERSDEELCTGRFERDSFQYTGSSAVAINYANYVPITPPTIALVG